MPNAKLHTNLDPQIAQVVKPDDPEAQKIVDENFDENMEPLGKIIGNDKITFDIYTLKTMRSYCEDNDLNPASMIIRYHEPNVRISFNHASDGTTHVFVLEDFQWAPVINENIKYH